jgi:hypothetical protein
MNSLRARGVMSFQALSAVGLAASALRRSTGSLCTTPPGTRVVLTGPSLPTTAAELFTEAKRWDRVQPLRRCDDERSTCSEHLRGRGDPVVRAPERGRLQRASSRRPPTNTRRRRHRRLWTGSPLHRTTGRIPVHSDRSKTLGIQGISLAAGTREPQESPRDDMPSPYAFGRATSGQLPAGL